MNHFRKFVDRHIGPSPEDQAAMLRVIGYESLDDLIDAAVPPGIRLNQPLEIPTAVTEEEALAELHRIAGMNRTFRSFIGQGYYGTHVPAVIQRTILENPAWYTAYTPYQPEISQGRLEAMLNFQTMVADLTGLKIANASMLDEGTAAAEAMTMCHRIGKGKRNVFFVSNACHPQTMDVVQTRAAPLGIKVVIGDHRTFVPDTTCFGVLVQYPDTTGSIHDFSALFQTAHEAGALCVVATDLLALTLLRPPGEFEADIAVGSAQRFGVPMGFGGPHAGFLATRDEFKRQMPGRLVGVVSKDDGSTPALRLALGTREQHIRREKATSNICTAQVLLSVMASMYALYHGPDGLRQIAMRVRVLTQLLADTLTSIGATVNAEPVFDTLRIGNVNDTAVLEAAREAEINLRYYQAGVVGLSLDETTTLENIIAIVQLFNPEAASNLQARCPTIDALEAIDYPNPIARTTPFLQHPVFNSYHTEHAILRYIRQLEEKDYSLVHGMIPLGSCTMKLNPASSMMPVSWPKFANLHPFAPYWQTRGYDRLFLDLTEWLGKITGLPAVSLQPNAGSQGEYSGLLAIRAYHASREQGQRNICLIPKSAHGTNPASAAMCGFTIVEVACDKQGNVDVADLTAKAQQHADNLACLMITYPSTHGVFESCIREICEIVHENGGQVYMDGANMNAMVGLARPGDIGADVMHLNLHKTFAIPHGGGGPGVGPICAARHLAPFLPSGTKVGSVSSAPYGSASILTIPWMYIRMMGPDGLTQATKVAILNANYIAKMLQPYFPVVYRGALGLVAHECIVDLRGYDKFGLTGGDAAKRLMDFGFHPPTISFPVHGSTFMIEPTESEPLAELDRFIEAMVAIHGEMEAVKQGVKPEDSPLTHAPHTMAVVCGNVWDQPYSREVAAFPSPWTRAHKFWPSVDRVDGVYGDKHPICSCQ